jgi:hypothetical protein
MCRSGLAFFTLPPEYRGHLFKQIHEIVFHGKGGYDWDTVYNMPIWLRRFTFNSIKDYYDKEKEEYDKAANKQQTPDQLAKLAKPPTAKPTYTTKAPKK